MMKRRTLLKLLSLLPFAGQGITKALAKANGKLARVYAPYLPTDFPKWNNVIDGLEDSCKWVEAIERSRLPHDMKFPRVGQIWETIRDCEVDFHPSFSAGSPCNGRKVPCFVPGGRAQLGSGEPVRILGMDDSKPLFVTFSPLRYQELQGTIVPEEIRKSFGYLGYMLQVKTARTIPRFSKDIYQTYLNEAFKLVQDSD
jgi:hypothetical protein